MLILSIVFHKLRNQIHKAKCVQDLKLIGTGEQAELLLGNCGELFFRPTCIRTCISSDYEVHNAGRLPIKFKWVLSKEDAKHLSIEQP